MSNIIYFTGRQIIFKASIFIHLQTNLCFIDLDSRSLQTPEELPSFPHRTEFIAEICDVLRRHKVAAENLDLYVIFILIILFATS